MECDQDVFSSLAWVRYKNVLRKKKKKKKTPKKVES